MGLGHSLSIQRAVHLHITTAPYRPSAPSIRYANKKTTITLLRIVCLLSCMFSKNIHFLIISLFTFSIQSKKKLVSHYMQSRTSVTISPARAPLQAPHREMTKPSVTGHIQKTSATRQHVLIARRTGTGKEKKYQP